MVFWIRKLRLILFISPLAALWLVGMFIYLLFGEKP